MKNLLVAYQNRWRSRADRQENRGVVLRWLKTALVIFVIFALLYESGKFVPEGFDWKMYFSQGSIHPIWTPWTRVVIHFLNWPVVYAITLLSIGLRCLRYSRSPVPIVFAVISLPTLWVLFMGNLDGLVLLGLLLLPWGVPLVLMKPQISAFALLANRKNFIAGLVWILISLLIWGPWPMNFFMVLNPGWKEEWVQDISLFPWGIIPAIPLLWTRARMKIY